MDNQELTADEKALIEAYRELPEDAKESLLNLLLYVQEKRRTAIE